MKRYALAALVAAFILPVHAAETLYMPNSVGGFIALLDEPCDLEVIKHDFPKKAVVTNAEGDERIGCWDLPEAPEPFESLYSVFLWEEGSPNVGTFRKHLFGPKKERWETYPQDPNFKGDV